MVGAPTLTLCQTCEGAAPDLAVRLRAALAGAGLPGEVRAGGCMSGCAQGPTLAVRAPGRMAYLFGPVGAADIPDLIVFLRLYAELPAGEVVDARPLGRLRLKALARIPAG